ncbi:hypothetical protein MNBD_NITROSPINAE01-1931 [hydrothermal vent metagenome]|uniref:O-antigen ligase-related domain-containing protein n=1 Tax=hydrothermal vent metagenome TaxID=652676 RepID=A0A3B1C0Y1_9ZZZZ
MNFQVPSGPSRDKEENQLLYYAFLCLIVWAPLPLGSNRQWAWSLLEIITFCIFSAWLIGFIRQSVKTPPLLKTLKLPLILLASWLLFMLLQAVPYPVTLLKYLSLSTYETFAYTTENLKYAPLSLDQGATVDEFLKCSSYVIIFFLTIILVTTRKRLKTLAYTIVIVGAVEAAYGLLNTLSGVEYVWWMPKEYYKGYVTGTFINRNHFAGYLEMVIPVGIGLLMASQKKLKYFPNWQSKVRHVVTFILEARGRLLLYIMLMFSAIFLTASRGGVVALFVALTLLFLVTLFVRGLKNQELRFLLFMLAVALVAGLWLGLGDLPDRYSAADSQLAGRTSIWEPALALFGDYLYFGTGAGTFPYVFPLYQDSSQGGYYSHAHNDYLELLGDYGLVGSVLLVTPIVILLFKILKGYIKRHDPLMRGMLFASLTGTLAMLIHATIDFNFHIPANSLYFYVLLGMGIVATTLRENRRSVI